MARIVTQIAGLLVTLAGCLVTVVGCRGEDPQPPGATSAQRVGAESASAATESTAAAGPLTHAEAGPPRVVPPGPVRWLPPPAHFVQECPASVRGAGGACDPDTTTWPERYDRFFGAREAIAAAAPIADCGAWFEDLVQRKKSGRDWSPRLTWDELGGPERLGRAVWEAAHMAFLIDGVADRPLEVFVISAQRRNLPGGGHAIEQHLVLRDRFAGDVPATLLLPEGDGAAPGIVVLPGHAETADQHLRDRYGRHLAARGFAVLAVSFRAYQQSGQTPGEHAESDTAKRFACQRQNLLVMRAYEGLLAARALQAHARVDPTRIGLLGHSGGSSSAYPLLWWKEAPISAFVLDNSPAHYDIERWGDRGEEWTLDCGAHEALYTYTDLLTDVCSLPKEWGRALRRVPYAYEPGVKANRDLCEPWPWPGAGKEPAPDDVRALDWFVPFFVEELGRPG